MRIVHLSNPLALSGRSLDRIEIRSPGRRVIEVMTQARRSGGGRFGDGSIIRFGARLSGLPEAALQQLDATDLGRLREAIEAEFGREARRLSARRAEEAERTSQRRAQKIREALI